MRLRLLLPCVAAAFGSACFEILPPPALPETSAPVQAAPVAPSEPPPPPPVRVPAGCELNLGGHYRSRDDARYRYRIEDDGRKVSLFLEGPEAAGSAQMSLERGPDGLVGSVQGEAMTTGGRRCPVDFEAKVTACRSREIVIQSVDALSIDESCRPTGDAQSSERVLVRDPTAGGEKKAP